LGAPSLAHPIDEWFAELRWTTGQGLDGRIRVPQDQREKLVRQPIVFKAGEQILQVSWVPAGADQDGRAVLEVKASAAELPGGLAISIPQGLMDDNQSLVGFLTFDKAEPTTVLIPAGGSASFAPATIEVSVSDFFSLGVEHIVEGYDHLLFLFCLLIAGGTLRHLVIVVTAFTVGHSITLALSVLGLVSLPSRPVESLIAFSIVVAALSNLRLPVGETDEETSRRTALNRGLMAGSFGLIHGLGFASMLMESGVDGANVVVPLVGFNLGVEAGQIALVVVTYPLLRALHRSAIRRPFVLTSSLVGALIGLYWTLERLGFLG
jgi:hypothetical protein